MLFEFKANYDQHSNRIIKENRISTDLQANLNLILSDALLCSSCIKAADNNRYKMDKRAVKAQVYSWMTEDLSEYWKLIGLSLNGISNGNFINRFIFLNNVPNVNNQYYFN